MLTGCAGWARIGPNIYFTSPLSSTWPLFWLTLSPRTSPDLTVTPLETPKDPLSDWAPIRDGLSDRCCRTCPCWSQELSDQVLARCPFVRVALDLFADALVGRVDPIPSHRCGASRFSSGGFVWPF